MKVDVEANQATTARYGVMSMPTFMVFDGGEPVLTLVGSRPKRRLADELAAVVSESAREDVPAGAPPRVSDRPRASGHPVARRRLQQLGHSDRRSGQSTHDRGTTLTPSPDPARKRTVQGSLTSNRGPG